jgi:hypothetical protein
MESKAEWNQSFEQTFAEDVGIPADLITDGAKEETGPNSNFRERLSRAQV